MTDYITLLTAIRETLWTGVAIAAGVLAILFIFFSIRNMIKENY